MKVLLVAESRDGQLLGSADELSAFAAQHADTAAMFLVGSENSLPNFAGTLYLADSATYGEFNPAVHKQLLLDVITTEQPDVVALCHSSYGWDLAPRIALALDAAQVSEVVDFVGGVPVVPACNSKLRREITAKSAKLVITLQAGAFTPATAPSGTPSVEKIDTTTPADIQVTGYEAAEAGEVDLSKAEVIVAAGRGIGKAENLPLIENLAKALGGEYAASRPVVDAEWAEHSRQVGSTGQTVAPKLYVACGISGAIQHLAGIKKSEFIVAINTDKEAPIAEVADVLVAADLKEFVPLLTEKLQNL